MNQDEPDLIKGLVAGIAGGLAASFVMEQFQALWTKSAKALQRAQEDGEEKPSSKRQEKPATVKAADAISKKLIGKRVPKNKQKLAGEAMHYAVGVSSAAFYGVLAETIPPVTIGEGAAFGTAVWLLADEISVPALGLSKPPLKIPASTHLYAFASHLVYGLTTELVRKAFRRAL